MRRPVKNRKQPTPDEVYGSIKVAKLINYVMERGKKDTARKIVYKVMEELKKEGESGQKKINEYTRYATVVLCLGQSWVYVRFLVSNDLIRPEFMAGGGLAFSRDARDRIGEEA